MSGMTEADRPALEAAYAQDGKRFLLPMPGKPKVKALVWNGRKGRCGPFVYEVAPPNRTAGWRVWVGVDDPHSSVGGTIVAMSAKDEADAMSISQADCVRRILSAIEEPA